MSREVQILCLGPNLLWRTSLLGEVLLFRHCPTGPTWPSGLLERLSVNNSAIRQFSRAWAKLSSRHITTSLWGFGQESE